MEHCYILGLHIGLHDSAAALICDGNIVAMAEQERFSGRKIAEREAPIDATLFCLKKAEISLSEVRAIALGTDWAYRDSLLSMNEAQWANWIKVDDMERYLPSAIFGTSLPPIIPIRHHISHASSAYRTSGFIKYITLPYNHYYLEVNTIVSDGEQIVKNTAYFDSNKNLRIERVGDNSEYIQQTIYTLDQFGNTTAVKTVHRDQRQ